MLTLSELYKDPTCYTERKPRKRKEHCLEFDKSDAPIQKCPLSKLDVYPKEIIFKGFEINQVYRKPIQITNSGRQTSRFEVLQLPVDSEFYFDLTKPKSSLASGMSATVQVSLKATNVNDKRGTLSILVENGPTLYVSLRAFRETPKLTVTGKELTFYPQNGVIDVGNFFVGSYNVMDACFQHEGAAARYFVLSELDWLTDTRSRGSLPTTKLYLESFTFEPSYFHVKNGTKFIAPLEFNPAHCGVLSEKVVILCDNGSSNTVTFQGHGVKLARSHIDLEGVEQKKYILPVNADPDMDDASCEWFCDLGAVFTDNVIRSFTVHNVCPAKNRFSYEWRLEPIHCKGRTSIPTSNVSITPACGMFTHGTSVQFQMSFKIPGDMYDEAGFVARLFCCLPRESICYSDFNPKTTDESILDNNETVLAEENTDLDITSSDPSFLIPSSAGPDCVCMASIEFWLDCRRDIAISLNPCYIDFQAPLTLNKETRVQLLVRNECSHELTCQWLWETDKKRIKIKMIPKRFKLGPFEEKPIDIRIKPLVNEPFKLRILCVIEENPQYKLELNIRGNVTIGEIKVEEDIVNYGCVKQGDHVEVRMEFKNYIKGETVWHLFKVEESNPVCDLHQDHFPTVSDSEFMQCLSSRAIVEEIVTEESDTNHTKQAQNQSCMDICKKKRRTVGDLIDEFKSLYSVMCKSDEQKVENTSIVNKGSNQKDKREETKYIDDKEYSENGQLEILSDFLKCHMSQAASKIFDSNLHGHIYEGLKAIYTGYLSPNNVLDNPSTFNFTSECPALEYKLFELRVEDFNQHVLVIADFCPPLVDLEPTMLDVGFRYVNDRSVHQVTLVNHTRCSWKYCWGQPVGIDDSKLKMTVDKQHGVLNPEHTETITLSLEPFRILTAEEFYVPCLVEGSKEPLRLSIKVKVDVLSLTIRWDTYNETSMSFHWPDDRLYTNKIDWCGLEVLQMCTRTIYREPSTPILESRSVQENFSLSRSDFVISSMDFNFDKSAENIQKTQPIEEKIHEENQENLSLNASSVQFGGLLLYEQYKGIFSEFLHFENVHYKVPTKQTITVTNPTENACKFRVRVGCFKSKKKGTKVSQYVIPTKRTSSLWEDMVDGDKGLVISVEDTKLEVTNGQADIDVWVYATTWGLYMDTLTLEFECLPVFHIPISVSIKYPPVHLTVPKCFQSRHQPVFDFSPISYGSADSFISIPVENTSGVPLKIFWAAYDEEEQKQWPSSVALDSINPKDSAEVQQLIPRKSATQAFYVEDNAHLMQLNVIDRKDMLPVHFNTNLIRQESSLFEGFISGYIWVDPTQVDTRGVHRESKHIGGRLHAMTGKTSLTFTQYTREARIFNFHMRHIVSSGGVERVKTFDLHNLHAFVTTCNLTTRPPFSIIQVVIAGISLDPEQPFRVPPHETVSIIVRCIITKEYVQKLNLQHVSDNKLAPIVCKQPLQALYNTDIASLSLEAHITQPDIHLSTQALHFPPVYIGQSNTKLVHVEITDGDTKDVQMPSQQPESPFSFRMLKGSKRALSIAFKFAPKGRHRYKETFEFKTYTVTKTLEVTGAGTEDQKYQI
ncbi:hypothetical protein M8J77_015242 [Diaphorina citri]|nr:hypothetical protein M8J77_015242 [Diaphorina citri]